MASDDRPRPGRRPVRGSAEARRPAHGGHRPPGLRAGPATGSPWRWFFSAIWLVYLIAPVSSLFGHGHAVL